MTEVISTRKGKLSLSLSLSLSLMMTMMMMMAMKSFLTLLFSFRSALLEIVGRYQVDNKDIERLLEWRHRSDF